MWHFLAALAVSSDMHQQQALVTEVREKVIENVVKAKNVAKAAPTDSEAGSGLTAALRGQALSGDEVALGKIRNVNTFLHALGLDASQITVEQ